MLLSAQNVSKTFGSLRAVAVLFLLLAVAAFMTGPSTGAVRARGSVQRGLGSLRGSAEAAGWQTGPVGDWIHAHRGALRVATFLAGTRVWTSFARARKEWRDRSGGQPGKLEAGERKPGTGRVMLK